MGGVWSSADSRIQELEMELKKVSNSGVFKAHQTEVQRLRKVRKTEKGEWERKKKKIFGDHQAEKAAAQQRHEEDVAKELGKVDKAYAACKRVEEHCDRWASLGDSALARLGMERTRQKFVRSQWCRPGADCSWDAWRNMKANPAQQGQMELAGLSAEALDAMRLVVDTCSCNLHGNSQAVIDRIEPEHFRAALSRAFDSLMNTSGQPKPEWVKGVNDLIAFYNRGANRKSISPINDDFRQEIDDLWSGITRRVR